MKTADVLILGGGLAGLCLARQLVLSDNALSITVVESAAAPAPVAAHKVGESTVEIGAHYLAETLELRDYLDKHHLKKFGLRCFFGNGHDIASADELGASQSLQVSSYQLDRGLLENYLSDILLESGVQLYTGAQVNKIEFDQMSAGHIQFSADDQLHSMSARWVIDASGRRGLLRRQFGLREQNGLNGNASWFRVNQRICVDDWSHDVAWHDRIQCGKRWLSTNHLMGEGYWVWLIPLSSGATSIGIVCDAARHDIKKFTTYERTLGWLRQHQPQCANALEGIEPMDHRWLRNYSYGCSEVFSRPRDKQRWAMTGESGLFIDPFYSPGMDFIAYANTFITDLVSRDKSGQDIRKRQLLYQQIFQSFYKSTLELYRQQYAGFGNYHLMSLKTVWDYAYYWGVLGPLFVNRGICDIDLFNRKAPALAEIRQLHSSLQSAFHTHAQQEPCIKATGGFTDHSAMPLMQRLNAELDDRLGEGELSERIDQNLIRLHGLDSEIRSLLNSKTPGHYHFEN